MNESILAPPTAHVQTTPEPPREESPRENAETPRRAAKPHRSTRQLATVAVFERSPKYRVVVSVRQRAGEPPYIATCGQLLTPAGTWLPAQRPVNWAGNEIAQLLGALREAWKIVEAAS